MGFDPSLYYQHGGITTPDQPDTADITGTPAGVDPSEDPTKNEYYAQRLQTPPWIQAGFPDYQSYAANLRLKEELSRSLQEKQIASGAQAAGVSASISTAGANQRAAVQAEIDRARNASDAAHQAAMDALAQGNAEQARKEFAISSQELQRYHTLDAQIRQQEANTSATTAGYNIYKDLTDKASNPRNFMQSFFTNRGATPPPGSAAYGNTPIGPQGIMPFEQFLPGFMRNIGLQGYGYGSPSSGAGASSPSSASAPPPAGGYSGQNNPANPYAGTNQNFGGSPTTADTAMIGGVKTWAGGPYSGQPVASSPSDAGDLMPYLKQGQAAGQARMMAQGGQVTMTAPHALVNMLTGRVAAIAGEAGKEHAQFDGAAIIDPVKGTNGTSPVTSDGSTTPAYTDTTQPSPDQFYQPLELPGAPVAPPPTPMPTLGLGTGAAIGTRPLPSPFVSTGTAPVTMPTLGLTPGDFGNKPLPSLNTPVPPPSFPSDTSGGFVNMPLIGFDQGSFGNKALPSFNPPPSTPAPNAPPAYDQGNPLFSTGSGIGRNPTFLPEEAAKNDPILAAMLQSGSFPPFLQRLYAQAKGLPGLGTNVPQQTSLPAGVPLISQIAYNQMSPSEQQAFASFLSAHGITLEDYLSMVAAASPQGGVRTSNPTISFNPQNFR